MPDMFSPAQVGSMETHNRIFMAPLTRSRADDDTDIPADYAASYYEQRASAGLIITEATQINPRGKGYIRTPGIYSAAQTRQWRDITQAVHNAGGKIVLQLWHVGRISHSHFQPGGDAPLAPSAIKPDVEVFFNGGMQAASKPRAMTLEDIQKTVEDYAHAAKNALLAGFDGIEIHSANGYLLDQFLRDSTNRRDDEFGGSLENRTRLLRQVTEAVLAEWPADCVGVRLSPTSTFNDINDSNPLKTFRYAIDMLNGYQLAYLHMVERFPGVAANNRELYIQSRLREAWQGFYIGNGDYDYLSAQMAIKSGYADAIAFGRPFISNPDLVDRFQTGADLAAPDPDTFYSGDKKGYVDYPFMTEK
ncbi:alkene reductase [Alteromonas aestuariivivens]|uniref:Alkene reductase n=1 Tax=Alteromonas aestuariivivens TaxID=1938339 RepID=A0A3D8M510_9ALTE|nr:alkene reductase [Alteromonas aestuariivivens]RDV24624.1 alkene reductase [Alteromonas aestuariivivens]